VITFHEFMSKKGLGNPLKPRDAVMSQYNNVKKLNTKPVNNSDKSLKKGPSATKAVMMPTLKSSGSMTSSRPSGKTTPKTPAEFLPRASGHADSTNKKFQGFHIA